MSLTIFQPSQQPPSGGQHFTSSIFAATSYINVTCSLANSILQSSFVRQAILPISQTQFSPHFYEYLTSNSTSLTVASIIALNIPLRAMGVYGAIQDKKYARAILQVAAFTSLFFPYGRLISISIDCAEQLLKFSLTKKPFSIKSPMNRLDPLIRENACKILGLDEKRVDDLEHVNTQYGKAVGELERGQSKVTSPFVIGQVQLLIDDAKIAYKTITGRDPA